jgi:hypothetical protein
MTLYRFVFYQNACVDNGIVCVMAVGVIFCGCFSFLMAVFIPLMILMIHKMCDRSKETL